jgi:hypothetical protein
MTSLLCVVEGELPTCWKRISGGIGIGPTFGVAGVFPAALGCRPDVFRPYVAQGPPWTTTLLHIAAYFDELEIAEWHLYRGMDPDAPAAVDGDGFGRYMALFSTAGGRR